MSKKNKKKFKNRLHQQLHTVQSEESTSSISIPANAEIVATNNQIAKEPSPSETETQKDLKRISLTLIGIVLLLILAIILDTKTKAFVSISDWLYQILNIQ